MPAVASPEAKAPVDSPSDSSLVGSATTEVRLSLGLAPWRGAAHNKAAATLTCGLLWRRSCALGGHWLLLLLGLRWLRSARSSITGLQNAGFRKGP